MLRRSVVGLAVLAMAAVPASPAATQGARVGTFVALTYNVAGLTEPISGSEPATNSRLISPLLNAYDLVLLQEDWADPLQQQGLSIEGLPVLFYHHEIVAEADHPYRSEPADHPYGTDLRRAPHGPTLVSDGLNRLSEFPFGDLERVMWDDCHGDLAFVVAEEAIDPLGLDEVLEELGHGDTIDGGAADCMAQKGFSVARTELASGVEVDVYNHHADAGGHPNDVEARERNFAQLADFIQEHSQGRAVILGGDTNLNLGSSRPERAEADAKVWEDFRTATGLRDVCEVVDCGDDAVVIDKFAFRSGGGVHLTPRSHSFERERFQHDGKPLSDHDPLAVTFRWRSMPAPPCPSGCPAP